MSKYKFKITKFITQSLATYLTLWLTTFAGLIAQGNITNVKALIISASVGATGYVLSVIKTKILSKIQDSNVD